METEIIHGAGSWPAEIALRPERPEDDSFLAEVYASTRQDELNLTNWDAATRSAFLAMQFKAMRQGYQSSFPEGQFSIILADGSPVGRVVVNRADAEIRVVDIVLLPVHCGLGIGTKLMEGFKAEAARARKPLRLCVFQGTRAVGFYRRLGFLAVGAAGAYQEMEWRPPF